jgi:putative ABC transport system ATP-binding protein
MTPLIEFRRLYKIYRMGDNLVRAVDGVSVRIDRGEFVAIVGQSGSGKSTCMNIIGCLDVPTSGEYLLNGRNVGKMSGNALAEIRNKMIGFIFQQYNLLPKLSVRENVEVPLLYAGLPKKVRRERALEVLERVGLSGKLHNRPNQLSGGEQQRVAIARALAGRPSVILADEPTGSLDSKTGSEVIGLIRELHREGNTIVLVTHDASIASEARRIIRLADGRVVFDGPASEFDTGYAKPLREGRP